MRTARTVVLVLMLMLLVILMVQNAQPVKFRFLSWEYDVSQLLLVVIVLTVGFAAGYMMAKMDSRRKKANEPPLTQVRR